MTSLAWCCILPQVLEVQDFMRGLQCALQQLHSAVMDLPVQPRERWVQLVQHVLHFNAAGRCHHWQVQANSCMRMAVMPRQ